jgi:D-3-phosphoglycerate dehydrogenase
MSVQNIRILVSDDVSDTGLDPLRSAGMSVEKVTGLKPSDLREKIRDYDGLVVRSETKVTAELIEAASRLRAVGRASSL